MKLHKSFKIKSFYQVLILCALVLALFYPAINAEISIVDDLEMISGMMNSKGFSLREFLMPRSAGGGYYRPLTGLTYYLDNTLWLMDSKFMHLENILFHLVNVILLYILARIVVGKYLPDKKDIVSIIASLIFAVHPITTESVNWISGRTDLLAGTFVIISSILLFRFKFNGSRFSFFMGLFAIFVAMLAKEAALGFILAIPLILGMDTDKKVNDATGLLVFQKPYMLVLLFSSACILSAVAGGSFLVMPVAGLLFLFLANKTDEGDLASFRMVLRKGSFLLLAISFAIALFYITRKIAFTSSGSKISNTIQLMSQDIGYTISLFTGAAAFYVKKFFIPLPLSFYILEVDPLYDLLGILLFFTCLYMLLRRNIVDLLSLTGISLFLPALPFAFATIAWTGYAERYIYMSSAFWALALSMALFNTRFAEQHKKLMIAMAATVIVAATSITLSRNIQWRTNIGLISDTVEKNPKQKELRGLYMLSLIHKGNLKAAREQYNIASSLPSNKYLDNYDVNMAGIEMAEGNEEAAEKLYERILVKSNWKSIAGLNFYTRFLENLLIKKIQNSGDNDSLNITRAKLVGVYEKLYGLNNDSFILYRLGQLYLQMEEPAASLKWFEKAAVAYPENNMYGSGSRKIAEKIRKDLAPD